MLGIGYLLRYPTTKVIDFSGVSDESWLIFFASDALHLIAFGILSILIFLYLSERFKLRFGFILAAASIAIIFFTPYIIVAKVNKLQELTDDAEASIVTLETFLPVKVAISLDHG